MAILFAASPTGLLEEIARGLAEAKAPTPGDAQTRSMNPIRAKRPLPAHVATWDSLRPGWLSDLPRTGWRVLVDRGPSLVEVSEPTDGELRFDGVVRGAAVFAFIDALDVAAASVAGDGRWELRVVEVPSLHMAALWLFGDEPLIIPLSAGTVGSGALPAAVWEVAVLERRARREGKTDEVGMRGRTGPSAPGEA